MKIRKISTQEELDDFMDHTWNLHDAVIDKIVFNSKYIRRKNVADSFYDRQITLHIQSCRWDECWYDKVKIVFGGIKE